MKKEDTYFTRSLYTAFIAFLSVAFLAVLYIRFRLIFVYYSDIGGIESNVIYATQRFLSGFPLYDNPEISPFSITQYSPLFYRLLVFLSQTFGVNPDNPIEVYRVSRSFALVANLLYTFLIFKIGRKFSLTVLSSLAVALIGFILLPPQLYSRPDSVSTLFSFVVIYFMLLYINEEDVKSKRWYLILVIVFVSFAITAKQSSIVLPLVVCSYLLFFDKSLFKAVWVGLSIVLMSVALLFILMPEHDLRLLYLNNVIGVKQGLDWKSYATNIFLYYFRTYALVNTIGIVFGVWLITSDEKQNKWLGWSAVVFFVFAALTSLKQGSALNYFTEFISLSPLMGLLFVKRGGLNLSREISALLVVVTGFWITAPNMSNFTWKYAFLNNSVLRGNYTEQESIRNYLEKDLRMRKSDKVFVTLHNYSFLNGFLYKNCILPQQEIVTVMYPKGDLNYEKLDKEISGKNVRFVITQNDETHIKFPQNLSLENYELKKKFNGFDVYELRKL